MDIDHLGESLIDQLVDRGLVADVADLYQLDTNSLMALDRFGRKSAENLLRAIAASKEQPLERLITGVGIELIGQVASRQLAEVAVTLENLVDLDRRGCSGKAWLSRRIWSKDGRGGCSFPSR